MLDINSEKFFSKDQIFSIIEHHVCKRCENYNHGEFSTPCGICKVSMIYQTFELLDQREE